jgi:hypothetical protein
MADHNNCGQLWRSRLAHLPLDSWQIKHRLRTSMNTLSWLLQLLLLLAGLLPGWR